MPQQRMAGISNVGIKETAKGQLFQVTTTDGIEYSTFNGALANQARQLVGQQVLLSFTEKQIQKNGQTYTNRYYEGAEPTNGVAAAPAPWGSVDVPQLSFPVPGAPPEVARELKIMRQTATKVAAHMLVYLPETERTPDGLVAIAEYLVSYYQDGPRHAPAPASHATADDIPF
jgi:hypothetical protein